MAGIEASKYQDLLPWPISREASGKMEFFDANGVPWDVKGPRSGISPSGNSFFNVESSGGSILKELREKKQFQTDPVGGTFRNNLTGDIEYRRVILDTTWLNIADYLALKNWMQQNLSFDELSRIVEVNSNLF